MINKRLLSMPSRGAPRERHPFLLYAANSCDAARPILWPSGQKPQAPNPSFFARDPVCIVRAAGAAAEVQVPVEQGSWLVELARLLLSEDDAQKTPEILLLHLLEVLGAERGFIVVREGTSYEQRFQVRFDGTQISSHDRSFSRTLVKRAIESQEILYSANVCEDPRFVEMESAQWIGRSCVLIAPLRHAGEVQGVVYLEQRRQPEGFDSEARRLVSQFADLAGLFLLRAVERESLRRRNQALERDLFARFSFPGIVTRDRAMLELLEIVGQVADSPSPVLVRGDSGTGKELVARAVHLNSSRRSRPFVAVHGTALPESLLESELFGHARGAFTGALTERAGRIASAQGGTLFLDEVAELPLVVQAKLLRFLQSGEIQRVGSDRTEVVDVRVVAATHRDLEALVQENKFRQDLYFRINVVELRIPALRERRGDVPLLLEHFLRKHWLRGGKLPSFSPRARQALNSYHYPGNVRELEHIVERACLLARGSELDVDLLPAIVPRVETTTAESHTFHNFTTGELRAAKEAALQEVEAEFLDGLMRRCGGNVSEAARCAGMPRSQLQRLLARHRRSGTP